MQIRKPAVAGQFYSKHPDALKKEISKYLVPSSKKIKAKGIVVPHAGYMYSGGVAGQVYSQIEIPDHIIILSPNHTGLGVPFSIMSEGEWELPLRNATINQEIVHQLIEAFPQLEDDTLAHLQEHSLEVQLPFIQYLKKDFTFVPITLSHVSFNHCQKLGQAIAKVIQQSKEPILIIASSDMNHYENQKITLQKNQLALDEINKMNPQGLYEVVHKNKISMCGIVPTTVMMEACLQLGCKKAILIDHKTSGDVSGDYSSVVGYAGIIIT